MLYNPNVYRFRVLCLLYVSDIVCCFRRDKREGEGNREIYGERERDRLGRGEMRGRQSNKERGNIER